MTFEQRVSFLNASAELDKAREWLTAIAICRVVEGACQGCHCHVALTGGTLYKEGLRKDLDLVFYRHGGDAEVNKERLLQRLQVEGFKVLKDYGRVVKCRLSNLQIDFIFPHIIDKTAADYPAAEKAHEPEF